MAATDPTGSIVPARLSRAHRGLVIDLARAAVTEVAPEELGLFDRRVRVFFRPRWAQWGRDPLSSGLGDLLPSLTSAALAGAQTATVLILFRLADVLGERVSGTAGGWLNRLRRRRSARAEPVAAIVAARLGADDLRDVYDAILDTLPMEDAQMRELIARAIIGRLVLTRSDGSPSADSDRVG